MGQVLRSLVAGFLLTWGVGGSGGSQGPCSSTLSSRAVLSFCSLSVLAPVPLAHFHDAKGQSEFGLLSLAEPHLPATRSVYIRIPASGLLGRKLGLTSRFLSLCEYYPVIDTEVRVVPDLCYALNSHCGHFWCHPPALFRNSFPWRV